MTYGELKTLVDFFLHRTDMATVYPTLFELARERIGKDARLIAMQATSTIEFESPVAPLPVGFLQMVGDISLAGSGTRTPLQFVDNNNFDRLASISRGGAGFWTMRAKSIEITPFAGSVDVPTVIAATYYQKPAKLEGDGDTNSVLENYPTLYLYAVLVYAHNSIQDLESEKVANQNYASELNKANESDAFGMKGSPSMFGV